jgi:hypothetical protein
VDGRRLLSREKQGLFCIRIRIYFALFRVCIKIRIRIQSLVRISCSVPLRLSFVGLQWHGCPVDSSSSLKVNPFSLRRPRAKPQHAGGRAGAGTRGPGARAPTRLLETVAAILCADGAGRERARAGRGRVLHGQGNGGEGDGALTLPDPGGVHLWFLVPSDASDPVDSQP